MAALFQTLLVSVALASVHVFAGKLRFLDVTPRSVWLSSAGGASVAYVFLHILPDLAQGQDQFLAAKTGWLANVERHVWLLSLAGLSAFYGLERLVHRSQPLPISSDPQGSVEPGVFWLHIGSFALYNLVFGYLLARRPTSVKELLFFGLAIGFHFVVNDFGLRMDHRHRYDHIARWVLAVAILLGWALGVSVELHHLGVAALFAVLAGGIILNVLKEELPEQRSSRFSAFALGVVAYSTLLLIAG